MASPGWRVSVLVGLGGTGAVLDTPKWVGWHAETRGETAVSVANGWGGRLPAPGRRVGLGGADGDT